MQQLILNYYFATFNQFKFLKLLGWFFHIHNSVNVFVVFVCQLCLVPFIKFFIIFFFYIRPFKYISGGCPRGVLVNVLNCDIVVSKFVLQLDYYFPFRSNTHERGMNPIILIQLWVEYYYSPKIVLALNNLRKLICY